MKEETAFKVMHETGEKLITHDDKLLLRALKTRATGHGRKGGIKFTKDYYYRFPEAIDSEGRREVVGYWNKLTDERHGLDWAPSGLSKEQVEAGWKESCRRRLILAEGVTAQAEANQLDLIIANLWNEFGSRYRLALDHVLDLVDRHIIEYRPIVEDDTGRNRQEAIRNRLKREFKPVEYEFDILFRGELGAMLFDAFHEAARGSPGMREEANTVYIAGFKRYDGLKRVIKFYDIGKRESDKTGRHFKLEITLLKAYFKSRGILVSDLLEQPKIQEMLREDIAKELKTALKLVTGKGDIMNALQKELELDTRATVQDITSAMLNTKRTLTERMAEIERWRIETDRRMAEHDRILAELREKRGR